MDPLSIAAGGMAAASARFEASAERTASGDLGVELGREAVEQIEASTQFRVNANVARVADQMLGSLLEIQQIGKKS